MTLFESLGVPLKTERGNRVFPVSDKAVDIVDAMVKAVKGGGAEVICGEAEHIEIKDEKVKGVYLKDGTFLDADAVIIATGGLSYPLTGSTGDGYFGQVMCEDIADRISKSSVIKEFSVDNLAKQPAVKTTRFTAVLFSTVVLILLVVSFIVLLVLTVIYCKGYWHRMIGGAIVAAGLAGYFFRIKLHAVSPFVKSMVDAVVTSFNNSAIVFASVTVLVGVLVLLIGKAVSDDEDDEYEVQ